MAGNLCHQIHRLEIGGDNNANDGDYLHPQLQQQQQNQQRAVSVECIEDDSNCLAGGPFSHLDPFGQYCLIHTSFTAVTSGGVTPAGGVGVDHRSDSSSGGHSSAERMGRSRSRIRRRRRFPPSSSSSTAAATNNGPPSRLRYRYDQQQGHPKKKVLNHYPSLYHPLTNSNSDNNSEQQTLTYASYLPSYYSSSTPSPYLLANEHNIAQQRQTLPLSSSSSIYNNHGQPPSSISSPTVLPLRLPPASFFPLSPLRRDLILHQQPVHPTHLLLYQYTFVLEEWVKMMRLMPSLQLLDLEIVSAQPSPSFSSLASGAAVDSARSSSSLLSSQSLRNVHPSSSSLSSSSPSPPSLSSGSSPTFGSRVYRRRQTTLGAHSFTSSCSGSEGGLGTSTTSSDDNGNDEEDEGLDTSGLVIDDGRVEENRLRHPRQQQQQAQQHQPSGGVQDGRVGIPGVVAATALFLASERDDGIPSRPSTPRRRKTQFDMNRHVAPNVGAHSSRRQKRQQHGYQQHGFNPRTRTRSRRQHLRHPVSENASGYDHHQKVTMAALDPSLVFQFPAVRSLIFRGPCVLLEVFKFLPNLDMLSFLPSPFGYGHPTPNAPLPIKSRMSSRSFSSASNTSSLFLELSQILQDKCPHITRLVLTEPSIMADLATVGHLPTLLHTMPARLVHVELSLRGRSGEVERDVIQALVKSHGDSLQSFVVLPLDNIYSGLDVNLFPRVQHENMQQQQQRQQEQGCGDQGPAGGQGSTPTPSTQQKQQQPHTSTAQPPHTQPANPPSNVTTDSHPLLSVLESCPSLLIADCHLPIPLQSVIASFPNWSCHSRLQVLRLELEELSGAGAMDADEEFVMEMFVKSMFIGSRASVPVDVDVEDEVEMSEVSSGAGGLPFLPLSRSPTSSGSTTPGTMVSSSSSGGSTTALPVHDTLWAPSLLDETRLASPSQSPSSSLSSWTTGSTPSGHRAPFTTSTESTSLGGSAQDVGQSRRREKKQQRVLEQAFAVTDPPLSLKFASVVSTASTISSYTSAKAGGSYFSPPTFATNTPSSSSSYTITTTSSSPASTPPVFTSTPSSNKSQDQRSEKERKSREAASAFLLSCANYQVDVVGKLTALQFLVEHQLATMPRLECFWLGGKMFRVPKRRSASSSLS